MTSTNPMRLYEVTSCPARRCSGICAPLNFVASLLWLRSTLSLCSCAWLRSTLSLRSCAPLNFDASLLWLRSASSLPDRSLNPQIAPLRNFVPLWTSAGWKKGRFRMAGHKLSWLLPLLGAACPSVSPDLLLAVRGHASSPDPCSLCHSFSPCRWPAASLCWWASVSNFFHCNFSQKPCERSGSGAKKKRQGSFLAWAWASCQLQRTCSSYLQRVPWQTIDTRGLLDLETILLDRSLKYQQTDSRKSAKKLFNFWKSLHVQVELYFSGIFERHSLVSFVEQRDSHNNFGQQPCERSGSWREHGRNGKDLFKLDRAASFGRKGHESSYLQRMWVLWQAIDTWTIGYWNLFYPTDTRNTDRLTQESLRQKLSKSLHVQRKVVVRWGFWEAGFGLLSGAPWFRRSGERGFDQRRMIPNFGDPSSQRHVGGRRRDTHTADKVLTHGQTLLFYRYRWHFCR